MPIDAFDLTPLEVAELKYANLLQKNLQQAVQLAQIEASQTQASWARRISERTGITQDELIASYTFDVSTKRATRTPAPPTDAATAPQVAPEAPPPT